MCLFHTYFTYLFYTVITVQKYLNEVEGEKIMLKQIFGLITLLIFSLSFPAFISAHSHMIESNPRENEVLHTIPSTVSITFNTPIQASFYSLVVYNKAGKRVDTNKSILKENKIENTLPDSIENGSYTLKWRIVSNDGHPAEGSLPFQIKVEHSKQEITINEKPKKEAVIEEKRSANTNANVASKGEIGAWETLIQSIFYLSLCLYIGVLFFYLKLLPKNYFSQINKKSRQMLYFAYAGLALSIIVSLPIQVLNITETLQLSSISRVLSSTIFGTAWIVAVFLLILLLVTTYLMKTTRVRFFTLLSFILLLALILTKSFIGHTMIASVQAAAVAMNFLHLLAMSLWLGGLLTILILLPIIKSNDSAERRTLYWQVLQSFSSWAILFVLVLLISGVFNSLLYLNSVNTLLSTRYGHVLLTKITLMLVMIMYGVYHFFKTKQMKKQIKRSIWIQFSLGIIVLVLAAILTHLPIL